MTNNNSKLAGFLDGTRDLDDLLTEENLASEEQDFIQGYREVIQASSEEAGMPDFDPLRKLKECSRARTLKVRTIFYAAAAVVVIAFTIGTIWKSQQTGASMSSDYSPKELARLQDDTSYALLTMSEKLNGSLAQLDLMKELGRPFKAFEVPQKLTPKN